MYKKRQIGFSRIGMLFIIAGGSVYWIQMKVQVFPDFTPIVYYNGDGIVNVQDLIVLAEHLFEEFPPSEEVE